MILRDPTALADIHSHLVPGVDDGARTLADALDSVERFTRLGVRKIVTTPHLEGSLTLDRRQLEPRLEEVDAAFESVRLAVSERYPEVQFERGHEVMLDVPDVSFEDARVRLAGTSFVLIEWPRLSLPPGTEHVLRRIREEGFLPIVAHPERYIGFDTDLALAGAWRDAGAYLQVNYGSLDGRFGADARAIAIKLLRRGWADYLASDFHGKPDLKIYRREAATLLEEMDGNEALVHLTLTNPARVIEDEPPLPVPMLPRERGFWARMKDLLDTTAP